MVYEVAVGDENVRQLLNKIKASFRSLSWLDRQFKWQADDDTIEASPIEAPYISFVYLRSLAEDCSLALCRSFTPRSTFLRFHPCLSCQL